MLLILVGLLVGLLILLEVGALQYAYGRLGISAGSALVILALELIGSVVNIPIGWVRSAPVMTVRRVVVFGAVYIVPEVLRERHTLIAVNVGGAVIPTCLSLYLLIHHSLWLSAAAATVIVAVAVRLVARPIPGLGVAVPMFFPGVSAALAGAVLTAPAHTAAVAFISGTCGTLIGADLLTLHRIGDLGAPVASIGGAGTFDGIFVSGIIAVLIVALRG